MTCRRYGVFIASLSVVALVLGATETLAGSEAMRGGGFAAAHPTFRPSVGRSLHHHRGNLVGAFWPGGDFFYGYGPSYGEPNVNVAPPTSGDVHYTYTYDVPWDAVHRFPPLVAPSARPYVPECSAQTVTVPRRDGTEQAVNITRCY